MTYKDFKAHVRAVEAETFQPTQTHPILFGLERLAFQSHRLQRLIGIAEQVHFATARARLAAWRRELKRVNAKKARLTRFNVLTSASPSLLSG